MGRVPRDTEMVVGRRFRVWWRNGLDEGEEQRVVHKFIDDATSLVKFRGVRRGRTTSDAQEVIANMGGDVDLSRGARDDVDLHQLFPPCAYTIVAVGRGRILGEKLVVE